MQTGEVRIQIRIQRVKKGRVIMTEQNQKKTTEWQREENISSISVIKKQKHYLMKYKAAMWNCMTK